MVVSNGDDGGCSGGGVGDDYTHNTSTGGVYNGMALGATISVATHHFNRDNDKAIIVSIENCGGKFS